MTGAALSTDVVILGAGASGLCAALTAYEQGAEVLLLEKSDLVGGTAAISGGVIWAPDNPVMRRAGLNDSAAAARAYFESLAPGQLDPPVLDAFLENCSEALAYCLWVWAASRGSRGSGATGSGTTVAPIR